MNRQVCITGLGIVNPSGIGIEEFWNNVSIGKNSITEIKRFDCEGLPTKVAGQLTNFQAADFIPRRFLVKTDTFTHYAWAATELALKDASLDLNKVDKEKMGVWLGNNAGGWDICQRGLYELYREGQQFVNPWQATAWFLSSPQGYLTIAYGIKGMSKSFVCDRASGACALYFGMNSIKLGHNDIIIAGGTEAPITPFALTCYFETGELSASLQDTTVYRPFDQSRKGSLLGEGSTILILEEKEHAIRRGAKIYGELKSGVINTDFNVNDHAFLTKANVNAMEKANFTSRDIDVIFAEGAGTVVCDLAEAGAISQAFTANPKVPVTIPKSGFGHLYGASTATDIACGLLAAKNNLIPLTPNHISIDKNMNLNIVKKSIKTKISNFIVNSRAREGSNVSLLISTDLNKI